MKGEKRTTGSVKKTVYRDYLRAGRGTITGPLVIGSAVLMQGERPSTACWPKLSDVCRHSISDPRFGLARLLARGPLHSDARVLHGPSPTTALDCWPSTHARSPSDFRASTPCSASCRPS